MTTAFISISVATARKNAVYKCPLPVFHRMLTFFVAKITALEIGI